MPSRADVPEQPLTAGCDVELIVAHMAASVGLQKAQAVTGAALQALKLPATGALDAASANALLDRLVTEPGLVGLAAKVTRQMLRMGVAPLRPAF